MDFTWIINQVFEKHQSKVYDELIDAFERLSENYKYHFSTILFGSQHKQNKKKFQNVIFSQNKEVCVLGTVTYIYGHVKFVFSMLLTKKAHGIVCLNLAKLYVSLSHDVTTVY